MLMIVNNLVVSEHISAIAVFGVGFASFFSACVFPIIPIYMSYLAGEGVQQPDGTIVYNKAKTIINTLFFVLGISTVFFILGLGAYGLSSLISETLSTYSSLLTKIAGIIIILFGLYQLGVIKLNFLNKEKKLNTKMNLKNMNILKAFIMGFSFSFAWTPCTGATLASVLTMAASSSTAFQGNMLILLYTLGFILPFIILGFFTTSILNIFRNKGKVILYATKIGAILLIIMGILTFTGQLTELSKLLG